MACLLSTYVCMHVCMPLSTQLTDGLFELACLSALCVCVYVYVYTYIYIYTCLCVFECIEWLYVHTINVTQSTQSYF